MLFILFGGTLEFGYKSRCVFKNKEFEIIKKYNYVESNAPIEASNYTNNNGDVSKWFDDKIYCDSDVVERCDFKYNLNGVYLGFNQKQIMDAIHGIKDCIITLAASSLEFIMQIKRAYGDYVTVIYTYMDDAVYKELILKQPGISETEANARIKAGTEMKKMYLEHKYFFDEIVIYSGEESVFNWESLERQYAEMIYRRKLVEKKLNNQKYVELPYVGSEPYIFISYSHQDIDQIYPMLSFLQKNGHRVWYDDGIPGGRNWRKIIASKIQECKSILLFSSKNAVVSEFVEDEINAAQLCHKDILTICLDDANFGLDIEMSLSRMQKLSVKNEMFEEKFLKSLPDTTVEKVSEI